MKKLLFTTKESGLKMLKDTYLNESEVCEGEFVDFLLSEYEESFDTESMSTTLIMETIQSFRKWAHERDELEDEESFIECYAEGTTHIDSNGIEYSALQDFQYFDGTPVASGVRVGVRRKHETLSSTYLDLDSRIIFA